MQTTPAKINEASGKAIAQLRAGDDRVLEGWYDQYRASFLTWAKKRFYATPNDLEDAWQESVVRFYEKVKSGKITELRCSIKTFLFAIGYKWLLKNERKLKRVFWKGDIDRDINELHFEFDDLWEEEQRLLREAMKMLSPKCQEMLRLRHYEQLDIDELVVHYITNLHKNEDTESSEKEITKNNISSQLSQCLSKLKGIIKTMSPK